MVDGGNELGNVPESVVIGGTFRAFSDMHQLLRRIEQVHYLLYILNTKGLFLSVVNKVW